LVLNTPLVNVGAAATFPSTTGASVGLLGSLSASGTVHSLSGVIANPLNLTSNAASLLDGTLVAVSSSIGIGNSGGTPSTGTGITAAALGLTVLDTTLSVGIQAATPSNAIRLTATMNVAALSHGTQPIVVSADGNAQLGATPFPGQEHPADHGVSVSLVPIISGAAVEASAFFGSINETYPGTLGGGARANASGNGDAALISIPSDSGYLHRLLSTPTRDEEFGEPPALADFLVRPSALKGAPVPSDGGSGATLLFARAAEALGSTDGEAVVADDAELAKYTASETEEAAPGLLPQLAGMVQDVVPVDMAALEQGVQRFLDRVAGLSQSGVQTRYGLVAWAAALAGAAVAGELARRRLRQTQRGLALTELCGGGRWTCLPGFGPRSLGE
jgi:hypothetical protein